MFNILSKWNKGRYCNVEAMNNYRDTPLNYASNNDHLDIVQYLVENVIIILNQMTQVM